MIKNGETQTGISLDKKLLDGVSVDQGVTFNVQWQFTRPTTTDWQDYISILDADGNYLMRNTLGFTVGTTGSGGNVVPGVDCKNGYAWDSCKTYATNEKKNLTLTIDNTGVRMYVDGVLACEKMDMSVFDFSAAFSQGQEIVIGQAKIPVDGDMQGKLYGVQVYHRALNAAEVEALAARTSDKTAVDVTFSAAEGSIIEVKKGDRVVGVTESGIPLKGLVQGTEYTYTVKKDGYADATGTFTAGTGSEVNVIENQKEYVLELDQSAVTIDKGQTATISAAETSVPNGTTITKAESEKIAVATVEVRDGKAVVTAIDAGETEITLTGSNGKTAKCTVTVPTPPEPTDEPTASPTNEPTDEPAASPTDEPTKEPAASPTGEPTKEPAATSTDEPTTAPTATPTDEPTKEPTATPTDEPTTAPTATPTDEATTTPTEQPTEEPTAVPTETPTPSNVPASLTVNPSSAELEIGESVTLAVAVVPANAANGDVNWISENSAVASVDSNGTVTAIAAGRTNIYAEFKTDSSLVAVCSITVKEPAESDDEENDSNENNPNENNPSGGNENDSSGGTANTPSDNSGQNASNNEDKDSDKETTKKKKKKTMKLTEVEARKGQKKITGKVSVKNADVEVKVGKKKYKNASVSGKKFTFKCAKLKKGTKITIRVTKKNYKTLTVTKKV